MMTTLSTRVKRAIKAIPGVEGLIRRPLHDHYYSPIPNVSEIQRDAARIFEPSPPSLDGVDLRTESQLELLGRLGPIVADQPWSTTPSSGLRYHFENGFYEYGDALLLHGLMRLHRPRRIVEVGSGFSSFAMLDTDERFLERSVRFTFVEPYDERLRSRLTPDDLSRVDIRTQRVQDAPLSIFEELEAGDFLFIDSSHVSKVGSDLNDLLFRILPRVRSGVLVHFHDVFYPFEYPRSWIEQGRFWNEAYLLRAFLQFNAAFQMEIWSHFLASRHPAELAAAIPLAPKDPGASVWLRRTQT